jgi:hypothetical protein
MNERRISTRVVLDLETGRVLERESYLYAGPIEECRGEQDKRMSQQTALSNQLNTQGQQVFGMEMPALQSEIENPGFTDAEKNAITQNALGSVNSNYNSAANEAENSAARTRNTGALYATLDNLARQRGRALSDASLKAQNEIANARLRGQLGALGAANQLFGINADNAARLLPNVQNSGGWSFGLGPNGASIGIGG